MSLEIFDDIEQGTDEWMRLRAGILTASTIGQMLTPTGKVANNDKTRAFTYQLVTERITGEPTCIPPTWDMARGTFSELYARNLYATHYAPVTETGFMLMIEPEYRLGYSPDGLVGDKGLIEIKSPRTVSHVRTTIAARMPSKYMAQIQAGLLVSKRDWCDFVSYCPGLPLYVERIYPVPAWQEAIITAATRFEQDARNLMADYENHAKGLYLTPYIDVFTGETYDNS